MTSPKITRRQSMALMAALSGAAAVGGAAPARAAGSGFLYVSHERSHNVLVLDPASDFRVVADIATSRRPRDMHFNNARTLLYVACGDDDVIDVIDVASGSVVDQIPTGRSPEAFVLSHDESTIYVSNEENSTCQVIDLASKLIIHEVPVGAEPEGVLLSPDGRTLYVTSEVADMVHVIDAELGVVTQNIIVGTRPRRLALTPDQRELWVSDELSGQISIIDVATNQVLTDLTFLPPGFRPVDVTPVGLTLAPDNQTMVITLGRANHIAYVNTATREIEGYTLVGNRAWNVCNSADGQYFYVTNGLSDDISIIEVSSRRNILSIPVGRVPYAVLVDAPV